MSKSAIYDLNAPSAFFRLEGSRHQIVKFDGSNREVLECDTGETYVITHDDWIIWCDEAKITEDFAFRARAGIEANLARPWDTFTSKERKSALNRHPYFMAMDDLKPRPWERRTAHLIEELVDWVRQRNPELPPISVVSFRKWDERWLDAGRDIRALSDLDFKKGNRSDPEELQWINAEIDDAVQKYMIKTPHLKANALSKRLQPRFLAKAADEGLALPAGTEQGRAIGHFRVQRRVDELNFRERKVAETGLKEARRLSAGIAKGPEPDRPLMEAESDHSVLDIILVDEDGNELGRAWLTTIFDRCTRQIEGFDISFEPPSWATLLQALLVAVRAKKPLLDRIDYDFINSLKCHGVPATLFVDRGSDFIGNELAAFGALLGCRIKPLPKASGAKKGKVERNYGTINGNFMAELPGFTGSRPDKIIREEFMPRMTLADLRRLFVAWWVDKYQNDEITGVGKPRLLWEQKMTPGYRRAQPSEDLLGSFESPLHTRTLTEAGIRIDNFKYHSDDLRMLLHRLGKASQVIVRPDLHDGNIIHVFDAENRVFVQGFLQGPYAGLSLSRDELKRRHKSDTAPQQTDEELLKEARGKNRFYDEIDLLTERHKQTLPDLSQPAQKASEHIEREILNPEASAAKLGSHDESLNIEPNSHDVRGSHHGASAYTKAMDGRLQPSALPGNGSSVTRPQQDGFSGGHATGQHMADPSAVGATKPSEGAPPKRDDNDIDDDDVLSW